MVLAHLWAPQTSTGTESIDASQKYMWTELS